MTNDYLESVKKQFDYYKMLGEKTFSQLTDEQLFLQMNEESNSIDTIVKHLWGNMLSRWTDFLTTDGEKEWRQRDAEFDNDIADRTELLEKWNDGWIRSTRGGMSRNIDTHFVLSGMELLNIAHCAFCIAA
jgi:hypothetical protein